MRKKAIAEQTGAGSVSADAPLPVGGAIAGDKLGRTGFAASAVSSIRSVASSRGVVVAIEGSWGSGKASTLAMIEELLSEGQSAPAIVRFNPWLVGDRDSLLRQFLAKLATAAGMTDHQKAAGKAAKELTAYSRAFDVLKLIPGAEPWASMVKSVIDAVGGATGAAAEQKAPDIEERKERVESALKKIASPIIVLIDDVDRLFPAEVFEMVRIIKAVGELPNVAYVVAWDSLYVSSALQQAGVPQAHAYLDKIVQVRLPVPPLSAGGRQRLLIEAIEGLDPASQYDHFALGAQRQRDRFSELYYSGLRGLLEQPRDIARIVNTVQAIERPLRGEIAFQDILGLAALMVKAPYVFSLLRRSPQSFAGRMPEMSGLSDDDAKLVKAGRDARKEAIASCVSPGAVEALIHHLFPLTAKDDDTFSLGRVSYIEGHIAAPMRLGVALQMAVSPDDISLGAARRFIREPRARDQIAAELTSANCLEFMEALGDAAQPESVRGVTDADDTTELCLTIARLVDRPPFTERAGDRSNVFLIPGEVVAIRAIELIVEAAGGVSAAALAASIVGDGAALSVATRLVGLSYAESGEPRPERRLVCAARDKHRLIDALFNGVISAIADGTFFAVAQPGSILWALARIDAAACPAVFHALAVADPTLDGFAVEFLGGSFDSRKGLKFSLPPAEMLAAYTEVESLKAHAERRLQEPLLGKLSRAAWLSVSEGKTKYSDGSDAR